MNPKSLFRLAPILASAALLAISLQTPLRAAAFPPLNDPASLEHHQGKLVWADLFTSDPAGATKFYTGLLGWTAVALDQKGKSYTVFSNDGTPVAGLAEHSVAKAGNPSRWIGYVAVDDISDSVAAVTKNGGVVHAAVRKFPKRGRQAIVGDTEGVPLGLLQSSSGDSPETDTKLGAWNWFELYAKSPKEAANFYRDALGYDVSPDNRSESKSEYLLSSGGIARGGIAPAPDGADIHATWLGVIRVADLDATLAKVPGLGGEVLVQPHSVEFGSRFAIILDSTGGTIGLVEYMDNANPATTKSP
jgi:predicted enzyme related to lactoylglutathione lyase